ncbi:MAG: ATP-binding protein [Acidimicrobiales bacterium]
MVAPMATFSHRIDADHRTLSDLRGTLLDWLGLHCDEVPTAATTVGDIDLVVTELAANVIDHTPSPWVQVVVTAAPAALTVEVSHGGDAAGLPDPESWGTIEDGDRGRGLRIVRALCDNIGIVRSHDVTAIRCRVIS